ncbi:MAG: hypothetical protein LC099_00630 [Anaerolineales bacterium]|nr:hypothetical protein [Anaerolineales bacterium]
MNDFIQLALNQLTVPPGDVIYYIVLAFSIASALQSAFNHWRASEFPQAKRAFVGLGILLGAQILMFVFSGLGWQGVVNSKAILPPMDRAFLAFSVVWIAWLYVFPEPNRQGDAVVALLSLLVLIGLGLSLVSWQQQIANPIAAVSYNLTTDNFIWQIASAAIAFVGIVALLFRRPDGMWYGFLLLTLGLLGHFGQIFFGAEGDYSGIVRLAYMAAFPILLTLPQRFGMMDGTNASSPAPSKPITFKQDTGRVERRRYSADPKTFHSLLAVAAESNSTKMSQALIRAVAQAMLADLGFMIYLTDGGNKMVIAGGYDLIREDSLPGGPLTKNAIPMLANSIQRGRALRLPASSTSADIKGLGDLFGLTNPGHLLYVPILTQEKEPLGGILLLSPYSDRTWSAEDQAFLANIAASLVPIIQRNQKISDLESQSDMAKIQIEDLEAKVRSLQKKADAAKAEPSRGNPAEIASLRAAQEESQSIIQQLQRENNELRAGKKTPVSQVERELKSTLQDVALLQNQLAESNMRLIDAERSRGAEKNEQAEILASISQELRQPLSSIVGYTDLLLGESVGILGALQRKFMDRIKISTERVQSLTDDIIRMTTLATDLNALNPETVDLNAIIDNAMAYTSSYIREKNISIHLDTPKSPSTIRADRESLQQIFIHLLQNAGAATPHEGAIRLKIQTQNEDGVDYILIQITDQGGGIPSEDIPRVFARLHRADNVLIQGVGDTGIGLSIAKTLTEAQHGRIWVESKMGAGSTFSVLLPIAGVEVAKQKRK